jgi:hypothetical protein
LAAPAVKRAHVMRVLQALRKRQKTRSSTALEMR